MKFWSEQDKKIIAILKKEHGGLTKLIVLGLIGTAGVPTTIYLMLSDQWYEALIQSAIGFCAAAYTGNALIKAMREAESDGGAA